MFKADSYIPCGRDFLKRLVVVPLLCLLFACSPSAPPSTMNQFNNELARLETVPAERKTVSRHAYFDGVVEAISQATVAAQTSGRIMALPFDVGDLVTAGDEIVRITSTEQGARVDAAHSRLAAAQARQSEADKAYQRARDVYERNVISRADFDRIEAARDAARAQVATAQASLKQAREALEYTVVRAPYSGTVLERHVRLGEVVQPGSPLITGVSLDNLRVAVNIPQSRLFALTAHRDAEIVLADGHVLRPSQLRIPKAADPTTHSFRVRLDLADAGASVLPGTLVKVRFVDAQESVITVPASALVRRGELTGVYVIGAGKIGLRYVRLATPVLAVGPLEAAIASGLEGGEVVATDTVAAAVAYKASRYNAMLTETVEHE